MEIRHKGCLIMVIVKLTQIYLRENTGILMHSALQKKTTKNKKCCLSKTLALGKLLKNMKFTHTFFIRNPFIRNHLLDFTIVKKLSVLDVFGSKKISDWKLHQNTSPVTHMRKQTYTFETYT